MSPVKNRSWTFLRSLGLITWFLLDGRLVAEERAEEPIRLPEAIKEVRSGDRTEMEWLWEEQLKPTLRHAGDTESLWIFLGTAAATSLAHQKDHEVEESYGDNKRMSSQSGRWGSILGSGLPGIALAAGQVYFDTDKGLQHARALGFTALTHISIAATVQRRRPNGKNLSFPSGHVSSSFATAASLAYAYGPWAGVPAFAFATYIGASRIASNAHWFSDVVAGAGLGMFWARASEQVGLKQSNKVSYYPIYTPSEHGAMIGAGFERRF